MDRASIELITTTMSFLSRIPARQVLRAVPARALSGGDETAIPTALAEWHKSKSGKMVPFAGYSLPVRVFTALYRVRISTCLFPRPQRFGATLPLEMA